jgi:hypothetical protein
LLLLSSLLFSFLLLLSLIHSGGKGRGKREMSGAS